MGKFKTFMKEDQLSEAQLLTKLKSIMLGVKPEYLPAVIDDKSKNLPAVGSKGAVDMSKRNMLKRSAATSTAQIIDMTPLSALVKLLDIDPTAKPYKIKKTADGYSVDDYIYIYDEEIEDCVGEEATLKKWMKLAAKAKQTKSLDDIMAALDATEGSHGGPDLFGGETYNGWLVELDLDDSDFDKGVLTSADQQIFDDNVFADGGWKKISPKAKKELARVIMGEFNPIEHIWIKCDIVLTLLPLVD